MNANQLAIISGTVLSLVLSYVPGARDWWNGLQPDYKRLGMLGLLAATSVGVCWYGQGFEWQECLEFFVVAAIANQTAYSLSPKV